MVCGADRRRPDFFRKQILAENLLRFAGGGDFHEASIPSTIWNSRFSPDSCRGRFCCLSSASRRARPARTRSAPQIHHCLVRRGADLLHPPAEQARCVPALYVYRSCHPGAIYVREAVVRPEPARACVHWIARLSGLAMLIARQRGSIALAMLVARPTGFAVCCERRAFAHRFSARLDPLLPRIGCWTSRCRLRSSHSASR